MTKNFQIFFQFLHGNSEFDKHNKFNSFSTRCAFMNESVFPEYVPTQWVSVSREVILHFLENRVSTTKCLFSCLQHKNIKKHSKDEI